jgi:hypothetical protein
MRIVRSTLDRAEVSKEQAETICAAIDAGLVAYQTYALDGDQKREWVRIVQYQLDGSERHALVCEDATQIDIRDTVVWEEVVEAYESHVRGLADTCGWAFTYSDVDGVPVADKDDDE